MFCTVVLKTGQLMTDDSRFKGRQLTTRHSLYQLPRYNKLLYFRCAFVDLSDLGIAH